MPVGSMPYLTRSGLPVLMLRSSFFRSSASVSICSTPRRITASCSSTDFTTAPSSTVHLEASDGLEGMRVVDDGGFAPIGRPAQGEDVEACGMVEQPVFLQKVQRQVGNAALLVRINRGGGALGV